MASATDSQVPSTGDLRKRALQIYQHAETRCYLEQMAREAFLLETTSINSEVDSEKIETEKVAAAFWIALVGSSSEYGRLEKISAVPFSPSVLDPPSIRELCLKMQLMPGGINNLPESRSVWPSDQQLNFVGYLDKWQSMAEQKPPGSHRPRKTRIDSPSDALKQKCVSLKSNRTWAQVREAIRPKYARLLPEKHLKDTQYPSNVTMQRWQRDLSKRST